MSFLRKNCCDGIYRTSIDVRFTKLCDNRCDFCIEDMQGIESLGKTNVDRMVQAVKTSVEMEGKDTVLILGGEPFMLVDDLCQFVSRIRDDVKKIYITTSMPKELDVDKEKIAWIMEMIDGLNVSLHHWDWERNNEILKATRNQNRIEQLDRLAWWFGNKIRIQCNLVKGGIESREDVEKMIQLADKLEVDKIKFNELQDVDESLYVSWDNLFPEHKLKHPYSKGCVNNLNEIMNYRWAEIEVKRACFMVQPHSPHGASLLDVVKVIGKKIFPAPFTRANVLYENGLRSSGWIQKDSLIHKEKV